MARPSALALALTPRLLVVQLDMNSGVSPRRVPRHPGSSIEDIMDEYMGDDNDVSPELPRRPTQSKRPSVRSLPRPAHCGYSGPRCYGPQYDGPRPKSYPLAHSSYTASNTHDYGNAEPNRALEIRTSLIQPRLERFVLVHFLREGF